MTRKFTDMNRYEWAIYINDHADTLVAAQIKLRAALEEFAKTIERCEAVEDRDFSVDAFVEVQERLAMSELAEEVRDYLLRDYV